MLKLQCLVALLLLVTAAAAAPQGEFINEQPLVSNQNPTATAAATTAAVGDVSVLYELLNRVLAAPDNSKENAALLKDPSSHFVLKLCNKNEKKTVASTAVSSKTANSTTPSCRCASQHQKSGKPGTDAGWFCMEQEGNLSGEKYEATETSRLIITGSSVSELSYGIGYYFRYHCNFTLGWERIGGSVRNLALPNQGDWPSVPKPIRKHRRVRWSYLMNVCTHSYSLVWHDWDSSAHGWEALLDWASLMGINNILALTGQEEIQYKVYQKLGLKDKEIRSWFNGPAFLTWSRGQNEYGSNIAGPLPRSWMQQQWRMQKEHILPRLKELNIVGQLPGFQGNVPIQLAKFFPDSKMEKMQDTGWLDALDPLYAKIADLWMSTMLDDFGKDTVSHWYQLDGYLNGGVPPWFDDAHSTTRQHNNIDDSVVETTRESRTLIELAGDSDYSQDGLGTRDEMWYQRGVAAFAGLNRTDPDAIWSFQGFSFIGWNNSDITANWLRGFVESVPPGRFVIIDMAYSGLGEWTKWQNASYFGADFIWSALHNFGDTDGMKGDLNRIASIIPAVESGTSNMVGIGATPEGIDQNPVYYEFLFDQAFVAVGDPPIPDVTTSLIERAHRRYGSTASTAADHVAEAWQLLVASSYANDQSVQDFTGVAHMSPPRGDASSQFEVNRYSPKTFLCHVHGAWKHLIQAANLPDNPQHGFQDAPFTYDLVNTGREVLAQLSVPMALNFSEALQEIPLDAVRLLETGNAYVQLLHDFDALLGSHAAFLVGTWIHSARTWGAEGNDCEAKDAPDVIDCPHFYEWNARVQITTWNPTPPNASSVPGGPIDYAAKHWNGLVEDYYAKRVSLVLRQALADAGESGTLNATAVSLFEARIAYEWTTSQIDYPTEAIGDPLPLSIEIEERYGSWFDSCNL